jgi:hypothetical protein
MGFDSNFYANQLTFAVFFDTGIATARVIRKISAVDLQICIVHSAPGSCFISLNKARPGKCVADTRLGGFARSLQNQMQGFAISSARLFEDAFCVEHLLSLSCA